MKTETKRTVALCRKLEKHGAMTFAVVAQMHQAPGWPDRFIAYEGGIWVEFKGPKTKVSTLQRIIMQRLRERGVSAIVLRFGTGETFRLETPEGKVCTVDLPLMPKTVLDTLRDSVQDGW